MTCSNLMKLYSMWSITLAFAMIVYLSFIYFYVPEEDAEAIYALCVALFHIIFGIWFFKGKDSSIFAHKTIQGRAIYGVFLLVTAGIATVFQSVQSPDTTWIERVYYYAVVIGAVELFSAMFTARALNKSVNKRQEIHTPRMTFKSKNRFVFGIYLLTIGSLNLISPNTLLSFFYLPETIFSGLFADVISLGPMHIVGVQLMILGNYNLFAARNNIESLVEAGMRGGALTVVFFIVLVLSGIFHPITLLLPAIDFVSIILIAINNQRELRAKQKLNIHR